MKNFEEIRIHKYLSEQGVMSRRSAEEAIKRGKITVNGQKAFVGQKIIPGTDKITAGGVAIAHKTQTERKNKKIYIMLYKPAGIITTMSDDKGRKCISDILNKNEFGERIYPAGRLDMYSEGLLILTNDGEIANKIMHPKHEISKIYHAVIKTELSRDIIRKLAEPIEIDEKKTSPAKISVIEMKNNKTKLRIEIFEGRNRQIRRMCENLDLVILKLKRVCAEKLNIGTLKPGQWRYLSRNEINYLKEL